MVPTQDSFEIDADIKPNVTIKLEPDQKMMQKDTEDDSAIDVTESKRCSEITVVPKLDNDETECSSSFGDTASGNEKYSGLSDAEVESHDSFTSPFDGFSSMFPMRKKKLTEHWKNYIRPLMWRCKYAELKAKQFQSMAVKYEKELVDLEKMEQNTTTTIPEGSCSRSIPFEFHGQRKKLMKRRKRKRVEDTTDVNSYMANHNLFSYFERAKSDADNASLFEDSVNPVKNENTSDGEDNNNNDWLFTDDNNTEAEKTLQKIESIHSRVRKMKAQLDAIMTKYACKFSSSESLNLLLPDDPQDFMMSDMFIPDIIESTVGLLSSADVTDDRTQVGDSSEKTMENIVGEMVGKRVRKNDNPSEENNPDSDNSRDEGSFASESEGVLARSSMTQDESTVKSCLASNVNFPRNKRKRGERKAGLVGWSGPRQGEPDSN